MFCTRPTTLPIYQAFGTRHPDTDPSTRGFALFTRASFSETGRLHLVGRRTPRVLSPRSLEAKREGPAGFETPWERSRRLMSLSRGDHSRIAPRRMSAHSSRSSLGRPRWFFVFHFSFFVFQPRGSRRRRRSWLTRFPRNILFSLVARRRYDRTERSLHIRSQKRLRCFRFGVGVRVYRLEAVESRRLRPPQQKSNFKELFLRDARAVTSGSRSRMSIRAAAFYGPQSETCSYWFVGKRGLTLLFSLRRRLETARTLSLFFLFF